MAGLTDYGTLASMNYWTGGLVMPVLPAGEWLGLCTTAPTSDTGSLATNGATEVTGGSYARVQVAGSLTAASATGSTITFSSLPSWVTVGMQVLDITTPAHVPSSTTVTIIGTPANGVTCNNSVASVGTDVIRFSAFAPAAASSGTEPVTTPASIANTNTIITFPQATASWGTATSWFLADAASGNTNIIWWDYLGNFKWLPFTGTLASPSVLTIPAHGYSTSDSAVVTQKFGGVLPASGSFAGILTVTSTGTDTITVGVNAASASGAGSIRKIIQQPIAINVTASFAAAAMTLTMA